MKKKHLHGKLSLKIKDLSAMNGAARQMGGNDEPTLGCTKDQSNCPLCEDPTMATCQGADTCDQTCAASCPGCLPTTPPRGCHTDETDCFTQVPTQCCVVSAGQQTCPGVTTC